ncbi:MAG UNVERIFIED_CONTAM: LuxR family transcriptional regulator [Rickettsiaceae bacterium]|jgi:DNA-binding CsgD family transcriptional regulator
MNLNNKICEVFLLKAENEISILRNLGISNFGYRKFNLDGTSIGFCTYSEWGKIEDENKFIDSMKKHYTDELNEFAQTGHKFIIRTGTHTKNSYYLETLKNHNMWNSLIVYKVRSSFVEGYYFISSCEHDSILNLFYNKRDYFETLSNNLSEIIRFLELETSYSDYISRLLDGALIRKIVTKFTSKNFTSIKFGESSLRKSELKIILMLAQGISRKTIAKDCNISINTVNTHIANVKNKLFLSSKDEIIQFVKELDTDFLSKFYG